MSNATCSVERCERKAHAKGYCNAHYRRLHETGSVDADRPPMPMPSPRTTAAERLDANSKRTPTGCLEWQGLRNRHGYGEARFDGKPRQMVHRVAYALTHGPIPDGVHIDHICGNPSCIEVAHLRTATPAENIQYRTRPSALNATGYRGVYQLKSGRWAAVATKDRKRHYLGTFDTAEEANAVGVEWRKNNYRLGVFDG